MALLERNPRIQLAFISLVIDVLSFLLAAIGVLPRFGEECLLPACAIHASEMVRLKFDFGYLALIVARFMLSCHCRSCLKQEFDDTLSLSFRDL